MDSYFTDRQMTRPRTCGLSYRDLTMDEIRALSPDLTKEEEGSPFARHFFEEMAPLQPHMEEAAKAELSPEECLMPGEAVRSMLFKNTDIPRCGYGVLKNGVGYAAALIYQDGITDEMIENYRENFAGGDTPSTLFYKLWYPHKHLVHFNDAIIEDFGWGFVMQEMNWNLFDFKEHVGVDKADIPMLDENCIAITGLGGKCIEIADPEKSEQTFMIQYTRDTGHGRFLWINYWVGVDMSEKKITICPNTSRNEMSEHMRGMMLHAMTESCNEVKLIKDFWNKTK